MQGLKLRILGHLAGAWLFRWYGLAAAFIVCLAGWAAIVVIPNQFESEAKVYIDTDTLLRPLLKGIAVSTDADQQVNVMLRTLLSTTNIERVVRATDPGAANAPSNILHDRIEYIQQHVNLRDLGTANLYSISFRDKNPRYAQQVTQSLLSVLIDSNLGSQRRDSDTARNFLQSQIDDYEQKLSLADKRRAEFKASHIDYFSAGSDGAVDASGGVIPATTAVTQAQSALQEAMARRNSVRAQMAGMQATLDVNAPAPIIFGNTQGGGSTPYSQLAEARSRLSDLRTHYTEEYPDIIALKNTISRLQAEIKSGSGTDTGNRQGIANPTYVALKSKLADEEANVAVAQERLANAQGRLSNSKNNAVDTLNIQRQYEDLNRDYTVIHENYQQLVSRRESASISQAAGSQQSAIFRVIDPPLKPDRPVSPNRPVMNLLVLCAGLGAGFVVALGLNQFQGRFQTSEQLSEAFAIPSIGTITIGDTPMDVAVRRQSVKVFAMGMSALIFSYLIVLLLFHTGLTSSQGNIL